MNDRWAPVSNENTSPRWAWDLVQRRQSGQSYAAIARAMGWGRSAARGRCAKAQRIVAAHESKRSAAPSGASSVAANEAKPPPQALTSYQPLDFARGDWRLCTVKFKGARRGTDRFMPDMGDTSWQRTAEVTLQHRQSGQQITAGFTWNGAEWLCRERSLRVDRDVMWAAIARGFARSGQE